MAAPPIESGLTSSRSPAGARGLARWPWLTLALAAFVLGWSGADATAAWRFDRTAIAQGEWWRLYTGNLVHFGLGHLAWNLVALLVAGIWLERQRPGLARGFMVSAPAAIGLALWLTRPELAVYAGLSGAVTGLAALLALCLMQRPGVERVWGGMLLVMILAKTGFDCVGRDALFARFDGEEIKVEPAAHLAGLAWAALFAATDAPWRWSRNRRECDRSLR